MTNNKIIEAWQYLKDVFTLENDNYGKALSILESNKIWGEGMHYGGYDVYNMLLPNGVLFDFGIGTLSIGGETKEIASFKEAGNYSYTANDSTLLNSIATDLDEPTWKLPRPKINFD